MNDDFRRDLAEKTRRGLEGRARQGLSTGGLPYGYRSESVAGARGEIIGYRRVVYEPEAQIVRRIFEEYAAGRSPREIAARLNAEGIASPAARWKNKTPLQAASWSASSLLGHRRLGKGLLYNPLYIGQVVWNRSQWRRDPDSGRETYRVRPKDDWITTEVPDLRIVPQDLWDRVQTRSRRQTVAAVGLSGRFRRYLLSGFVTCAVCGGAYVVKTPYSYRCGTHHDRGAAVCANDRPASRASRWSGRCWGPCGGISWRPRIWRP